MSVINFYEHLPQEFKEEPSNYSNYQLIKLKIPKSYLFIGPSGSGKTSTLMNFLRNVNGFTQFWIIAKHVDEPLYAWLIATLNKVSKKLKKQIVHASTNVCDLPPLEQFNKNESHCLVFDDQILSDKASLKKISEFYVRGRHQNITPIMMSQNYYSLPKIIRSNASGGVILKKLQSNRDLKMILNEYNMNVDLDTLLNFYNDVVNERFENFLLIKPDGTFCKNFGVD
jgi:hypothetical protein